VTSSTFFHIFKIRELGGKENFSIEKLIYLFLHCIHCVPVYWVLYCLRSSEYCVLFERDLRFCVTCVTCMLRLTVVPLHRVKHHSQLKLLIIIIQILLQTITAMHIPNLALI
jgi:hypothetical protein